MLKGEPLAATQPTEKFFQAESSLLEAHQFRRRASPPTSIDGLPGGKRPIGFLKSGFEKNVSMGWEAAEGVYVDVLPDPMIRSVAILSQVI